MNLNRTLTRLALLLAVTFLCSAAALAQNQTTTGEAGLGGEVDRSVHLTSYSTTTLAGNFGGSTSNVASGSPINTVINFGEVSANNTTADKFVYGQTGMLLRSNCGYLLRLERSGNIPDGAGNSGTFQTGDIGVATFSYNHGATTGLPGTMPNAGADAIAGTAPGLYNAAANFPANVVVTNGQPAYTFTLNQVGPSGSPTTIIAGTRISRGGDNTTYLNRMTILMRFAVKPQYYTPATFSETLSFSIVASP